MPRGKKKTEVVDPEKLRDIEAYTHEGTKRPNNPPAGLGRYDKEPEAQKTYHFDPHLDPALDWAGKKEGTVPKRLEMTIQSETRL